MADYIEREALIDALMLYSWQDEDGREISDSDELREYINGWMPELPADDVVEVVRCKNCKYHFQLDDVVMCGLWREATEEEGFCSNGTV